MASPISPNTTKVTICSCIESVFSLTTFTRKQLFFFLLQGCFSHTHTHQALESLKQKSLLTNPSIFPSNVRFQRSSFNFLSWEVGLAKCGKTEEGRGGGRYCFSRRPDVSSASVSKVSCVVNCFQFLFPMSRLQIFAPLGQLGFPKRWLGGCSRGCNLSSAGSWDRHGSHCQAGFSSVLALHPQLGMVLGILVKPNRSLVGATDGPLPPNQHWLESALEEGGEAAQDHPAQVPKPGQKYGVMGGTKPC